MKAVILAGGLGTRLSEETSVKPKPMVEIGGKPILWHLMKIISSYGINDFIICCGYKGYYIKEYFQNYNLRNSDITFNMLNSSSTIHKNSPEQWNVTCVDTGEETLTGGRLKRVREYLDPDESFLFTYGDGLGNVDIESLIKFHESHGKLATVTTVNPPGRFGILTINENKEVTEFNEKPKHESTWINGGFFILNPSVIDYIENDATSWEEQPLRAITQNNELAAFKHKGFWQPMDTLAEKRYLEGLHASNKAPWMVWK
ncbi:glucose-1-phosphate cytidylyltransferase [Gammaproteobacteria bacterium]|nr:glucose-1-phosphate cytidylyltransferase [Gammaproteobacteria bacterium]